MTTQFKDHPINALIPGAWHFSFGVNIFFLTLGSLPLKNRDVVYILLIIQYLPPPPDSRVRLSRTVGHVIHVCRHIKILLIPKEVRFAGGHTIGLLHISEGEAGSKGWAVTHQGHSVTSAAFWQIIPETRSLMSLPFCDVPFIFQSKWRQPEVR